MALARIAGVASFLVVGFQVQRVEDTSQYKCRSRSSTALGARSPVVEVTAVVVEASRKAFCVVDASTHWSIPRSFKAA
jgi:hypothetical protein